MRTLFGMLCAAVLSVGMVDASNAWQITANDLTDGASSVDLGFATAIAGPRPFEHKTFNKNGQSFTGVGIEGGFVGGEIDINGDEYIQLDIVEATKISEITIGFLFENGNHHDEVDEIAVVDYWDMQGTMYTATLSVNHVLTGLSATWSGVGSASNVPGFAGVQDKGGLWQIINPFGDMVVSKMKFRANNDQSDTVVRNEGSDYVLVSVNVPEPSTVLLLGGGLLALVGFGRKYMKK